MLFSVEAISAEMPAWPTVFSYSFSDWPGLSSVSKGDSGFTLRRVCFSSKLSFQPTV